MAANSDPLRQSLFRGHLQNTILRVTINNLYVRLNQKSKKEELFFGVFLFSQQMLKMLSILSDILTKFQWERPYKLRQQYFGCNLPWLIYYTVYKVFMTYKFGSE